MKLNAIFLLNLVLVCAHFVFVSVADTCVNHEECLAEFHNSPYAICKNRGCVCSDFFAVAFNAQPAAVDDSLTCVKGVPISGSCERKEQCQVINPLSTCNAGKCVCYDLVQSVKNVNGKCHIVRKLHAPCISDDECILGSNDFARCVEGMCACHSSAEANFVATDNGMCEIPESGVDISVLAITMSISTGIFVLIVVLYMVTEAQRKQDLTSKHKA